MDGNQENANPNLTKRKIVGPEYKVIKKKPYFKPMINPLGVIATNQD